MRVAAFGTLYLSLGHAGAAHATNAFAIVTAAFAAVTLTAIATAHSATRVSERNATTSSRREPKRAASAARGWT